MPTLQSLMGSCLRLCQASPSDGVSLFSCFAAQLCIQRYLKGINVALAFCMGTDLQNIVNNPIGQPMATVERW